MLSFLGPTPGTDNLPVQTQTIGLPAIALTAVWMKDRCNAPGVFTDVAFRLDCIEVSCQQFPNPVQMPGHLLNVSCESMAKV
jgi:hypothetical protein